MSKIKKLTLSQFLVCFLFSASIFLWSIQILFIHSIQSYILQFRFLYLLLVPIIIYEIIKKKHNLFERQFLILLFAFLVIFLTNIQIVFNDFKILFSNLILLLTLFVVYFKYEEIKNISLIIYIFLFLFFISLFLSGYLYFPEWFNTYAKWTNKCGGIPVYIFCNDYFPLFCKTFYHKVEFYISPVTTYIDVSNFKLGIKEKFFLENSHASLAGSAITLFLLSKIIDKKSIVVSLIAFFFIMVFFIKSTTTFYLSILLSFFIIFCLNFKTFTKKKFIVFLSVLLFFFITFISDIQCTSKIKPIFNVLYNDLITTLNLKKNQNKIEVSSELSQKINNQDVTIRNMTSSVVVKAYEISILSLFDKPFGWGFNNFKNASKFYSDQTHKYKGYRNYEHVEELNLNDASNTFFKLVTEFGIYSFLIFAFLLKYLFEKKIPLDEKLFCFTLILSQLIRGVGYFNSGFLIILIFIVIRSIKK